MSEWLHITGNIRIITQDIHSKNEMKKLTREIGKKIGFVKTYWSNLPKTILPTGSEGSLEWSLTDDTQFMPKRENVSALQNISLTLHGDLRDVSDTEELEQWLQKYVTGPNLLIDFGVVSAKLDSKDVIYNYTCIDGVWLKSTIEHPLLKIIN